ncbi:hypothetical protein SASPL_117492 [Salvia splendens]|uniref:Uncharacterized protein n=1 Tax=Salvia splendens TaxID=180675 RepID=A0A8X8Y0N2_SALSN|nr:hypothetical protein SASPL_117492 [Salvia splendens]
MNLLFRTETEFSDEDGDKEGLCKTADSFSAAWLSRPFSLSAVYISFICLTYLVYSLLGFIKILKKYARKCEANLELLFPQEDEVVESTFVEQKQNADLLNASMEAKLPPGEEATTLAAIKAKRYPRRHL